MLRLNRSDRAYLAGILDGEGYIGLHLRKPSPASGGVNPYWLLRVAVNMSDKPVVDWLASLFPCSRSVARRDQRKSTYKRLYGVEWSATQAVMVLSAALPFMRGKKEQAELALSVVVPRYQAGNRLMTNAQRRAYTHAAKKIAALKRRSY